MDIFSRLAEHLDNLPGGFPPTESGVELRILRQLFSPEEAELALHLLLIPEGSRVIARRAKIGRKEADRRLQEMAKKGLILSIESEGKPTKYVAAQFVIGIWESQVESLTPELNRDLKEYFPTLINFDVLNKGPQLRTIPVGRSVDASLEIKPYEKVVELVQAQEKCLVAPCICRREQRMMGHGCEKPLDSCLAFGLAAE
jgi:hypothetical protein